jgi:SHS2 domain-containing protein
MEVKGKTLKELLQNLVIKLNKNVEFSGNSEKFATKFEIKGENVEEIIERFSRKIIDYYYKKKAIFEELETEIIPSKKWKLKCSLSGKIYENVDIKIKEIKIEEFEETIEGWRLEILME